MEIHLTGGRRSGDLHNGREVDRNRHRLGQTPNRSTRLGRRFDDRNQPEVAVAPGDGVVTTQGTQHRHPERLQRFTEQVLVPGLPTRFKITPAILTDGSKVEYPWTRLRPIRSWQTRRPRAPPEHRAGELPYAVPASGWPSARSVEETHDAFHDENVGPRAGPARQPGHGRFAADPTVEIARRPAGGQRVVPGVDEVGSHLGRWPPSCRVPAERP